MKKTILGLALLFSLGSASLSHAQVQIDHTDTFTGNNGSFSIDFTSIGNAGNAADTTGYGSVAYNYNIGTYTICQSQIDAAGVAGVTAGAFSGLQPAGYISWYDAAAFVNFLNTSTGHQAAYNLTYINGSYSMALWSSGQAGYDEANPFRNSLATYFLPSENEWYKAAYYNAASSSYNLYPTGNRIPTEVASGTSAGTAVYGQSSYPGPAAVNQAGGASAYGTMGQGGNVWQWQEGNYSGDDPVGKRALRGGYWAGDSYFLQSSNRYGFYYPDGEYYYLGFRVASAVPEPSTYALFGLGAIVMLMVVRRKKTA
jgi:hypothetical protein